MRVGIFIEETWSFFHEIFDELKKNNEVTLFERRNISLPIFQTRVTELINRRDLMNFLSSNDVAFFEWASELLAHATRLPKSCGIVTRLHRYEMYHWVDQINWDMVDKIILVSQAKKREFIRRFPAQASKVVVIPEAVSLNKFRPREKVFNGDIGTLCDLTPRKRVYELILAFSELNRAHDGFRLHIGGGKHPRFEDYYEAVFHLVSELGIEDKVIFYGQVNDPQDWYSKIDIFVSNSYSEGLQVSPLEAIASGCYCLSHGWEGADELFPEENIFYTDRELIERILRFSAAPADQQKEMIEKLGCIVREGFDLDKIKIQIRQLVEEVGANGASSR
jgi:glycosyltransferase involved in cell wall biosynthesis